MASFASIPPHPQRQFGLGSLDQKGAPPFNFVHRDRWERQ